jgi:TolB-like protein/tetratricopeptide (TPR) repeat protein
LVMRALAKDAAQRPSAAELLVGLDSPSGSFATGASRRALWSVAAAALLLIVGGGALALASRARGPSRAENATPTPATPPVASVAVMPFVNIGGDRNDEYFSDGLSDELAHALVRLPGVRVTGRASANAFRGRNATAPEIGRALGVASIIEGTVRRSGRRLRVTAQLTSTADGHVLWTSEPFQTESADVFQVQDEFTRAVVAALAPSLRGETAATIATTSRGTRDTSAYDLYLHGRYFWSRRGKENLYRAIDYFRRAAAADPHFARAHAGLAMTYAVMPYFDPSVAPDSLMRLAQKSAERALELDPAIADAHLALANVNMRDFRLNEARRHFLAALADSPLDPTAHAWYGDYLARMAMIDSALAEKRRAVELEPLSALLNNHLAQMLYTARRPTEARAAAQRMMELDSTFTRGYATLARIQLMRGFPDSSLVALATVRRFGPLLPGFRGLGVLALAAAARQSEARQLRDSIIADPDARRSDGDLMFAALAFGDHAAAIDAMEQTNAAHELVTVSSYPGCDPLLEPLHDEPRFLALMRRLGVAVCSRTTNGSASAPAR